MEANRTRRSTTGIVVSEAAYAAFTRPRDSPFHNVSVPLGDANLTAGWQGVQCGSRGCAASLALGEMTG